MSIRFYVVFLTLLAMVAPVSAQVAGRLTGSVVDPEGQAVPSATIRLMLPEGTAPMLATVTTTDGIFNLTAVRPDFYDLVVEAPGFQTYILRSIKVDPALETSLPAISLLFGTATFRVVVTAPAGSEPTPNTVEVTARAQNVQLANAEVTTTITNEQVRRLPVLDRQTLLLTRTQAGVNTSGDTTVINGQRTSSTNVTLDGINIQDNYIRDSFLFTPNLITLDQVAEFTLITSNANASMGGGASQVSLVTPSGTNDFHGSLYFYNRNNALAANTWFNNKDGIEKPSFNQNQVGGTIGGPILQDKLFFYTNYEAFRFGVDVTANNTILTEDARSGIFTYEDLQGTVNKVNILQAAGVSADPAMEQLLNTIPGPEESNNFRVGDSRQSLLRNTAGFSFLREGHHNRDNVTLKLDYILSTANVFSGSFLWNRQDVTRSDLSRDFSIVPKVSQDDNRKLLSAAWRWSPGSGFTNEVRGGFNLAPLTFDSSQDFGDRIITQMSYTNPVNTFRAEGRNTDTFTLMDNASYVRGKHIVQFGFQTQQIRAEDFDDVGITPTYSLGIGIGNPGLGAAQLPGASSSDLAAANSLLATLAGYVTSYSQAFNITSRTSGFVDGARRLRHFSLNNYAFYLQDSWKVRPDLTLNLGLRYELPSVVDERDSLSLLPIVENNDPVATLLSNATLDFAGSSAGRPWHRRDKNNFAPNIGLAWDVFGDAKTSLRAAYSINYVNDETLSAIRGNVNLNQGLNSEVSAVSLSGRVSTNLPPIPVPTFKVPRTFQENFQLNPFSAFGLPDPDLRTPYVQQWNVGIQREIKDMILEVRYVGNHSTKLFRSFDHNPVVIRENGFLDDFKRALQNGTLSLEATGVFDPDFNSSIPGSQQLTVFPTLAFGGLLFNPVVRNQIQTGQAAELAFIYHISGLSGLVNFYRNPFSLASNTITNYSNASYNALQIDIVRRFQSGLQFQANYTYGKVLSDSDGTGFSRFEEFRDPDNGEIDRSRPSFDITHALKGNAVYDLPFGEGLNSPALNHLVSGWTISGIMTWQSGNPFSILSRRGTLTRVFRSGQNTAASNLDKAQLDDILQFRMTEDGPFIVASSAIGSDGRAVAPDGTPPFSGQAFSHPGPGQIGALQRRWFSGPSSFNLDLALLKNITIVENQSLEIRMEALNIFNNPTWSVEDQDVSSVNFGRITSTANDPRRFQFSLHYRF